MNLKEVWIVKKRWPREFVVRCRAMCLVGWLVGWFVGWHGTLPPENYSNMTLEHLPSEDVFPFEHVDFPMSF